MSWRSFSALLESPFTVLLLLFLVPLLGFLYSIRAVYVPNVPGPTFYPFIGTALSVGRYCMVLLYGIVLCYCCVRVSCDLPSCNNIHSLHCLSLSLSLSLSLFLTARNRNRIAEYAEELMRKYGNAYLNSLPGK